MWARMTYDLLRGERALSGADPWLELAAAAGPTTRAGPLTHDWLLPSRRDPTQLGLNVFSSDAESSARIRAALMGGARELGADVTPIFGGEDDSLRFHGGMAWRRGEGTIKIYVSGPPHGLDGLAMALGVRTDDDVFALGVDVSAAGPSRARSYRRAHTQEHSAAWAGYPAWAALEPVGLSHRVVASLEPPHATMGKRSFDHIFGPEAEMPALFELANEVARIDDACPVCFDAGLLAALEAALAKGGWPLRPVSYEVDVFADGTRGTDALVTVGERLQSPS